MHDSRVLIEVGDEKEREGGAYSVRGTIAVSRHSSFGSSTGIAKPALTRSITTIVLKPLMSGFS